MRKRNKKIVKAVDGIKTTNESDIYSLYNDYIEAIENPDRIGWDGTRWVSPELKGYDKNNRGYGVDIVRNESAEKLTRNRPGRWLTDDEMRNLMGQHIRYVENAAKKHIRGFDAFSLKRKAAIIGMLYRGDSVNNAAQKGYINLNEKDDDLFLDSINNYYKNVVNLPERAKNSKNFFSNLPSQEKTQSKPAIDFSNTLEKITVPVDNTKVDRIEYKPLIKSSYTYKSIPWGGVDAETFGGRSSFMKKGNKLKLISKIWKN